MYFGGLKTSCALKTFVGISKIQKESSPTQWNYVKRDDNPADLPSRGLSAQDLKSQNYGGVEQSSYNMKKTVRQGQE